MKDETTAVPFSTSRAGHAAGGGLAGGHGFGAVAELDVVLGAAEAALARSDGQTGGDDAERGHADHGTTTGLADAELHLHSPYTGSEHGVTPVHHERFRSLRAQDLIHH